jgi:hypothetical protein
MLWIGNTLSRNEPKSLDFLWKYCFARTQKEKESNKWEAIKNTFIKNLLLKTIIFYNFNFSNQSHHAIFLSRSRKAISSNS